MTEEELIEKLARARDMLDAKDVPTEGRMVWPYSFMEEPVNLDPMMQFFAYNHLPGHLQEVSQPFYSLADHIISTLPRNPERTVALRKLLEAKDCAVRAKLYKEGGA